MVSFLTMEAENTDSSEMVTMIADYMEKGFLENIIDMFRHDYHLYDMVGHLIKDDRMRVRIGTTALMEELRAKDPGNITRAIPGLLPLLKAEDAVVRGDAVNLLGIAGSRASLPSLEEALSDDDPSVRMLAAEAIEEIKGQER